MMVTCRPALQTVCPSIALDRAGREYLPDGKLSQVDNRAYFDLGLKSIGFR